MSVQSNKSLGKRALLPFSFLFLVASAIVFFAFLRQGVPQTTKLSKPGMLSNDEVIGPNRMDTKVEAAADKKDAEPKDYYDQLSPLETVIAELESLETKEIDEKIKEVEQDIIGGEYIEKSNAHKLDEAGFRQLAQLMQLSDALHQIKINRQLLSLESDLGIKKKGT